MVLCKVRLVGAWIKRREVGVGVGRIRIEKQTKSVWWNDEVEAVVGRREVLAVSDEEEKERCMEVYREEKREVKRCIYIRAKRK